MIPGYRRILAVDRLVATWSEVTKAGWRDWITQDRTICDLHQRGTASLYVLHHFTGSSPPLVIKICQYILATPTDITSTMQSPQIDH